MSIQLIVGLGNPGTAYENTRHNVGFWFLNTLAHSFTLERPFQVSKKFCGEFASLVVHENKYFLLKPQTYMNDSGQSIAKCLNFYKIPPKHMLVVHDDLDFPTGKTYLKFSGGHGGHNGLRHIIQHIGPNFWRLRIGIDHPRHRDLVHDYVLSAPSRQQKQAIEMSIQDVIPFVPEILAGNFDTVMSHLHYTSSQKDGS